MLDRDKQMECLGQRQIDRASWKETKRWGILDTVYSLIFYHAVYRWRHHVVGTCHPWIFCEIWKTIIPRYIISNTKKVTLVYIYHISFVWYTLLHNYQESGVMRGRQKYEYNQFFLRVGVLSRMIIITYIRLNSSLLTITSLSSHHKIDLWPCKLAIKTIKYKFINPRKNFVIADVNFSE